MKSELEVLQKVMNKYIACVYGWTEWPGSMALILEYMPGGNLTRLLDDEDCNRSLMLPFLRIFFELASGLAFIHNLPTLRRVVHGDLKPENALLTSDLHCKLSDFGSAQIMRFTGCTSTSENPKSTKVDTTWVYAPPEKLKSFNTKPKKEQDTYSFGMILYVMLSGSPPCDNPGYEKAFIESIIRGERPDETSIQELRASFNEDKQQILDALQSMMRRCWVQNPSERPTMIQVRNELQTVLQQHREEEVLAEVTKMVKFMSLTIPKKEDQQFQPIHDFMTKDQRFVQG